MKTTEVTDLHGFFKHIQICEQWNEPRKNDYEVVKKNLQRNDVLINSLNLMLHGESTLTKEMSERHFPRHTVNLHKHLKQIRPMAEEMYHKALKDRRRLAEQVAYHKDIFHRQRVKYDRMLSLYQRMKKVLIDQWENENPDKYDPQLGYSIGALNERYNFIMNTKFKYEILSDMFGSENGYHARLSKGDLVIEV